MKWCDTGGAAGGIEAIFSAMSVIKDQIPPTLNLETMEESMSDLDFVPGSNRIQKVSHALNNGFGFGFGFGGVNAALIVSKP
jgi:3-oxoacyl-[acyl-carrier-protein] synthase II